METKKSEKADIEKGRFTSLLIGFVFSLSVMFTALEWTERDRVDNSDIYAVVDIHLEEELIPITLPEKKTVPPPPQSTTQADIIDIIEDDADIEEDVIASTEDQVTYIDITEIEEIVVEEEPDEETVFMIVEDQPEFPGGQAALMEYLRKNIKYPSICRENNIQGRVIIQFVVNRDGTIVDPEVVRSVDPHLDKEALRVVSGMPKWKPGLQRGKPVRVKFTLPVNFKLN